MKSYVRKPFVVQAVQVTEENMVDLSEQFDGEINTQLGQDEEERKYIKIFVHKPLHIRHTQAFVGDWILLMGKNKKVYSDSAFLKAYELATDEDISFEQAKDV